MSINRATISGNLTRDAELRSTASGMPVLSFSVAVNDRRKNNQTGEWEDVPNFIDCTMFGKRASSLRQYLTKGMKVFIDGKLRWSQWERDGQKRSKLEVIVDELVFGSSLASQQGGYQPAQPAYAAPAPTQAYSQPQPYSQPAQAQPYQPPAQAAPQQAAPVQQAAPAQPAPAQQAAPVQQQMPMNDTSAGLYDDDIPF